MKIIVNNKPYIIKYRFARISKVRDEYSNKIQLFIDVYNENNERINAEGYLAEKINEHTETILREHK